MRTLGALLAFFIIGTGCWHATRAETSLVAGDAISNASLQRPLHDTDHKTSPIPATRIYNNIEYEKTETLKAAPGTKSVLFNRDGSKLFAMNLEGMSIYEFDQPSRKVTREFRFKPTKGTGWDYDTDKPIPSFEEKPVEACLSHNDQILWVSLHNAEGIVPIRVDSLEANNAPANSRLSKKVYVSYTDSTHKDSFYVPLVKTGKTPKIISRTEDSKHLLVSNWHSLNISVLSTNKDSLPPATLVRNISVPAIPRGIVVDDRRNRSYVAIMGGASIAVINHEDWKLGKDIAVESNPRHIVMDTSGRIFVSYNRLGKIACIDALTGNTLFTTATSAQPRTIMLSKDQQFLFVTCYSSDMVEVYKVHDSFFSKVASLPCKGHPVGVDIFEDSQKLEAWVCSYTTGSIQVFTFRRIE